MTVPISKLPESQVDSELASLIAAAGPDERRVLLFICRRFIGVGQRDFGQLDLRSEMRDGFKETAEEAADGLFYMSLWFLLQQINRPLVPEAQDTEPGQLERPSTPRLRSCEVCGGPGPVLYDDKPGARHFARYCCVSCHSTPQSEFFTRHLPPTPSVQRTTKPGAGGFAPILSGGDGGSTLFRNEAGQLIEDDDVPDEDWPR